MNPHLHDPVNAVGICCAIIGGALSFGIILEAPTFVTISGLVLWAVGVIILAVHTARKK